MTELEVPLMGQSLTGGMPYVGRCLVWMNAELMKQLDDPESTRDFMSGSLLEVKESISESGFGRVDALSGFFTREFNAILRSCGVLRTAQSFPKSESGDNADWS